MLIWNSGIFTLPDLDSDSDSDSKLDGYIVLYRNCSHCTDSDSDSDLDLDPHCYYRPQNEVWGKVIFLHLFVILFTGGLVSQHAPGSHYIRSCTGAATQLVWRQHTGNIKCMMR